MKHFDTEFPKPEIVIALAGPVGTNLDKLSQDIETALTPYRYHSHMIKVSKLIKEWAEAPLQYRINNRPPRKIAPSQRGQSLIQGY